MQMGGLGVAGAKWYLLGLGFLCRVRKTFTLLVAVIFTLVMLIAMFNG